MNYMFILVLIAILTAMILKIQPVLKIYSERRAIPIIENIIFSETSGFNKETILKKLREITNNRLDDYFILDYFYKIKGIQLINNIDNHNYWIKKYLSTQTHVKLNYFEQAKFYNEFLNHSGNKMIQNNFYTNKDSKKSLLRSIITQQRLA